MIRALIVGNSDGIGLALTRRLLDDGWTVTGISRRDSGIAHERYSHRIADVTDPDYPPADLGAVDLCVYCAGVGELFDVNDFAAQTQALRVNLLGAARTVEAVVPGMITAGRGHFVGLSSIADVMLSGEAFGYAASKAGLSTYLLGLRMALRPHGVAVTTVRFGFVDTKMAKGTSLPMMIPVAKAVDVIMHCIRRRPAVVSYPRLMSVAGRVLRLATRGALR